jgi:hypothetical protein
MTKDVMKRKGDSFFEDGDGKMMRYKMKIFEFHNLISS